MVDIREHYISSFLFHVIVLLLAAALTRSHMGTTDVVSVSLSADTFGKSPVAAQNKVEMAPKAAGLMPQAANENTAIDEETNP